VAGAVAEAAGVTTMTTTISGPPGASRGATLIELVAGLIALAVLAGLLVPAFLSASDIERIAATKLRLEEYRTGLGRHWMDVQAGEATNGLHALPAGLTGLLAPEPGTVGWKGPYIRVGEPSPLLDAWGAPLLYARAPGTPDVAVVLSSGPDGRLDSDVQALLSSPDPQAGGDDIFVRTTTRPIELDWAEETEERLNRVAAALKAYLVRHDDAFPASLSGLVAEGLIAGGEIVDRWGHPLRFQHPIPSPNGAVAYTDVARIYSLGPNEADDGQAPGSDDLVRIVRQRRGNVEVAFTAHFTASGGGGDDDDDDDDDGDDDDDDGGGGRSITVTLSDGTRFTLRRGESVPVTLRLGEPILVDGLQRGGDFCLEPRP